MELRSASEGSSDEESTERQENAATRDLLEMPTDSIMEELDYEEEPER
jgi:hypothetical protein